MSDAATYSFQTEAKQLLKLMIHSLYSNREIFLRELVSNASDACDKLRYEALSNDSLYEGQQALWVRVSADPEAKTITVEDNGIGLSRDEVVSLLGTIAKSGTAEFVSKLSGDAQKDSQLIGQFGVGFYSAFIVADRVDVYSRRAGLPAEQGVHWQSAGEAEFSVADIDKAERGTRIVLHLKDDALEFANDWQLRSIINKYSDHIAVSVEMPVNSAGDNESEEKAVAWESVNSAQALWTRSKSELSDEDYENFYRHVSHDFAKPLTWSHNRVEGKLEYTSLLYVPTNAPFDLYQRDAARGLKLYVQRTFIMDDAEQFLPLYLRFIKGVIDSNDLSLNVSREILQQDATVDSIKTALTKRVLDMLEKLSEDEAKYQTFWQAFGNVLKEGMAEDFVNRERIAKLLRFSTTHGGKQQDQRLTDYVSRMKEKQTAIYYVVADSYEAASRSPYLEVMRKNGIEVLLLSDRLDEWMMTYFREFDGKSLVDIARGDLDISELAEPVEAEAEDAKADDALLAKVQSVLDEQVALVRYSKRLVDSASCLVVDPADPGFQMRRMLEAAGQALPASKPIFELNAKHPLVVRLQQADGEALNDLAELLFEQAQLLSGEPLADPAAFVERVNRLLL